MTYVLDVPKKPAKSAEPRDVIRDAIMAEYERRGLNPYQLWKLVEPHGVSRTTVYEFVDNKNKLRSDTATHFLAALGIKVTRPR